jgi:hypothetical protein
MRRLQRLRGPAFSLPTCSASSIRTCPAAGLLKNELVTSSSQTHSLSARRTHLWQSSLSTQRRCLSTSTPRLAKSTDIVETSEAVDEAELAEIEAVQTDLVYPTEIKEAPRPNDVTDAAYVPATRAEGLEEVGGLEGWWDKPEHWGPSKQYVGFGPVDRVTDPAVLEVLTKQAVVEAIVLRGFVTSIEKATTLMADFGSKEQARLARTELAVGPDGAVVLKNEKDLSRLRGLIQTACRRSEPEGPHRPSLEEAKAMMKSWGADWKSAELKDPFVMFYTIKRIQKLTGQIIPDGKLVGVKTIGALIARVIKPPKAKKLAEEIKAKGDLLELPNVHVYPRRLTPVDKENMVGRWKLIEGELQKRGLPVLGTGGHRKAVEKSWLKGGV